MKKVLFLILCVLCAVPAHGEEFLVEDIVFTSHGVQLEGSIVFPNAGNIHSGVVFVHGSGKQARNLRIAKRFAAEGIAALVYDKRGAGHSGGVYEGNQSVSGPNIALLADDAVAALKALGEQSEMKGVPLGLTGISQAGWIVPLAAEKSGAADFIVLWSGPVAKVSEEDIYSKYTADRDGKQVPSFAAALEARTRPYVWPDFLGKDTDPSENLARLNRPGLWVFGGRDGSVPIDLSIERLKSLIKAGYKYEYVFFSDLGHNNMSETFVVVTDWIKRLPK